MSGALVLPATTTERDLSFAPPGESEGVQLVPLDCFRCGRFMAMVTRDNMGPTSHAACDALFMLQEVVPTWPFNETARRRVEEWKKAFPGLPWDSAYGHRRRPPTARSRPPAQVEHRPARGLFLVKCESPRCPFTVTVPSVAEIPDAVQNHLRKCRGHRFSYERV